MLGDAGGRRRRHKDSQYPRLVSLVGAGSRSLVIRAGPGETSALASGLYIQVRRVAISETATTYALGALLVAIALAVRLGIHVGARPGGVDTWYYLASADALRQTRRLPVRLPQYLFHDPTESYPPGLIVLLAAVPQRVLRRWFWLVSPVVDAVHLVFVYVVTYRLTGSPTAAVVAGGVYALTPQLVAETRSLNPRSLGTLLCSVAMYLILRTLLPPELAAQTQLGTTPWFLVPGALIASAALFLTHTTTSIALIVATSVLSIVFADARYVLFALGGFIGAMVLSGGLYLRVLENHLHAVRFWRRNIAYRGAHAVLDSPIYREHRERAQVKGWQGGSLARSAIRLVGENPFILAMLVAATPTLIVEWWGQRMYWWSIAILGWATAVTFVPPLRVVGPGFLYMKASVFPTAFSLALLVGAPGGWTSPAGLIVALSFVLSIGAITTLYVYLRRRPSERTSSTPLDLAAMAADLRGRAGDRVLCLPTMYSDFLSYASGKKVLWGGHSGDLSRYEALSPVIRRPLEELIDEYDLSYVVIDLAYTDPERLRLSPRLDEVARHGNFALYRAHGDARSQVSR